MSEEKIPWWELPGAPGENRTREQYNAHVAGLKEANPSRAARPKTLKADKIMTREEYLANPLYHWHSVCWNYDGEGSVGIKYDGRPPPSAFHQSGDGVAECPDWKNI